MQAIQYDRYGPPEVLTTVTLADPEPGPGEARVRLLAAGVAPIDTKLRAGLLQAHFEVRFPKIPGRDGVGIIDKLGAGVVGSAVGDQVCVIADPRLAGTYAEAVSCITDRIVARPRGLTTEQAAALLQPGLSAWIPVVEVANIQPGMRVLVHGGAGAVGGLMVQLARHLGAHVTSTCRSANCDFVIGLGAHDVVAYDRDDFGKLRDLDVVFDLIGGDTHARSYPVLHAGGHLVCLTAAPIVELGGEYRVKVTRALIADAPHAINAVARLADAGVLRPTVAGIYPLGAAVDAHRELENGRVTRGRLVLRIAPDGVQAGK